MAKLLLTLIIAGLVSCSPWKPVGDQKAVACPTRLVLVNPPEHGKVIMFGYVLHQGPLAWSPGLTLRQAITRAGGFIRWARLRDVVIVEHEKRNGRECYRRLQIDLRDPKRDTVLRDRSIVIVPENDIRI